jgi:hypothetical protein
MSEVTNWAQVILLTGNLGLVAWYLSETAKMRRAAEQQVDASQRQLEAQTKPALTARLQENTHLVELVNIGSGPALHLEFWAVPKGSTSREGGSGVGFDRIVFLEPRQTQILHVATSKPDLPATFPLQSHCHSLRCEYRSLSGRVYFSVFDFNERGTLIEDTHFGEWGR